jgi:hypothetical protein
MKGCIPGVRQLLAGCHNPSHRRADTRMHWLSDKEAPLPRSAARLEITRGNRHLRV